MFTHRVTPFDGFSALHMTMAQDGSELSFARAIAGWRADPALTEYFCTVLADVPFEGFFWETPPVTAATAGRPFEMVLIDSPALSAMRADPSAFAAELQAARREERAAATFANRGGDALLIAPVPAHPPAGFGHLAAFLRTASRAHRLAFWQEVGEAVEANLGSSPLWLSTSGLAVPWLHVRLDSRPKYYQHAPFRQAGA
ncbi:MAG: DUF6940 family protein [Alphaproteobacteria bacterium]